MIKDIAHFGMVIQPANNRRCTLSNLSTMRADLEIVAEDELSLFNHRVNRMRTESSMNEPDGPNILDSTSTDGA